MTPDRVSGPRVSTDAVGLLVHGGDAGRRYALSPGGETVYGRWLPPGDGPAVIEEGEGS
jgi:hypothetical protein